MTEAAYWKDFNICKSCVIQFVPQPPLSQVTSTGPWEGWQVQLLTSPRGFAPPRFYASDEDLDRPLMRYHQLIFEALSGDNPVVAACTFIVPHEKRPRTCEKYFDVSSQSQTVRGIANCAVQFGYIKCLPQAIESPWDLTQMATAPADPAQTLSIRLFATAFFKWFTGESTGFEKLPPRGTFPARKAFSQQADDHAGDFDDDWPEQGSEEDTQTFLSRIFPPGTDTSHLTYEQHRAPKDLSSLAREGQLTEDEQRRALHHMKQVLIPLPFDAVQSLKIVNFVQSHQKLQEASWLLKEIQWRRPTSDDVGVVSVLVDHVDGPCILQVLANVLILRGAIRIQPALQAISYKDVHKLIHQFMQDNRVPPTAGREVMGQFNALNHILFAMTNPTTLDAGFGSTWDIEDTRRIGELGIMELCGVRVCHGRLPGPDDKGYHQLMEAAWVSRAESLVSQWREEARNPEMTNKQQEIGRKLETFLRATDGNQVTEEGRQALAHELSRGAVQAFWNESGLRVIYYSTDINEVRTPAGLKSNLFELVFDENQAVVWKRVAPKDQPSEFFDAQFNLVAPAAKTKAAKKRKKTNKANNQTNKRLSNRSSSVTDPAPAPPPSTPPVSLDQRRPNGTTNDPRPASPEEDKPKRKSLRIQAMGHVVKKKVSRIFRGGREGE